MKWACYLLPVLLGAGWIVGARAEEPLVREAWDYAEPMREVARCFRGTPGVVLHLGDSITADKAYRQWALEGEGKTEADVAVLEWMHAGTKDNRDGWWLCGRTAAWGLWADELLAGGRMGMPPLEGLLAQYEPQIAIVMIGANDVANHRPLTFYRADVERIVDTILGRGAICILSTIPPHPQVPERVAAYNEAIRQIAAAHRLPLIDLEQEIVRRRPEDFNGSLVVAGDAHPSAAVGAVHAGSAPTAENLRTCGYLLRGWLTVQKVAEVKRLVLDKLAASVEMPAGAPAGQSPQPSPPEDTFTQVLQGSQLVYDALIDSEAPDERFGTVGEDNRLRRHDVCSAMLMRFVLEKLKLPPKARVVKASVVFYVWDPSSGNAKTKVAALEVKTPWKEREASWSRPARGQTWKGGTRGFSFGLDTGPPVASVIVPPDQGTDTVDPPLEYRLNVTELVCDWLVGRKPNYGLAVTPMMDIEVDQGMHSRLQIYASEHPRPQWVPKLEIVATTAPAPTSTPEVPSPAATPSTPAGELVRLPAVADAWISGATPQESNTSAGKAPRLKLKTVQEMALIRFDASAAKGREVLSARLFLRRAGPDKLRYLRVSTVNQDWAEGNGAMAYGPPNGATFNYADGTPGIEKPWAWRGSTLADVIMTSGHSLGSWGQRTELQDGWICMAVTPELIYALALGDSDGLAVMEGGNLAYENNYFYSVQSKGSAPYLEVRLGKPLDAAPAAPIVTAVSGAERAHLASGAIRVSIGPAENVFCWRLKLDGQSVARWRVSHPVHQGETAFYLEDLAPGKEYRLEVVAVSPGDRLSPAVEQRVKSSSALERPVALGPLKPPQLAPAAAMEAGALRVWALPGLVKISPTTSQVMCGDLGIDQQNAKPSACANPVWDGKQIRLFGARGEYVSYQLCLENRGKTPLEGIRLKPEPLKHAPQGPPSPSATPTGAGVFPSGLTAASTDAPQGPPSPSATPTGTGVFPSSPTAASTDAPQGPPSPSATPSSNVIGLEDIELFSNWYAKNSQGQWQPAYCVPITPEAPLAIPDPRRGLADQQNQTVYVDVYIPKQAAPGNYAGRIVVEHGDQRIVLPVALEVLDFVLPDRLSFWPELNGYRLPPGGHDAYRLAHRHRCVLNCKGFGPKLEGEGSAIRVVWEAFDEKAGPLLSGQAFAASRRAGVPIECMYLPFRDSWPTPLSTQTYAYKGYWPGKGDDAKHLVEHSLTAPYLGQALSRDYQEAFLAVQRQFFEHFREKGYTQTEMQCLFDGKSMHRIDYGSNMWWTTDEPLHWDDWLALQFFCHLWTVGRGPADPRLWPARADISRPQWQGRVLNHVVDVAYFGAGGFSTPAMVRRCRVLHEETGVKIRSYGTAGSDERSNTQNVTALLQTWSDGADAFLPWQTLGSEEALDTGDAASGGGCALLVPGTRLGHPVLGDMRLKAYRDAEQIIEYLTLLGQRRGLVREQLKALLDDCVPLASREKAPTRLDDADSLQFGTLSAWQIAALRRRLAEQLRP